MEGFQQALCHERVCALRLAPQQHISRLGFGEWLTLYNEEPGKARVSRDYPQIQYGSSAGPAKCEQPHLLAVLSDW